MIAFDFNWSDPLSLVLLVFLIFLGGLQIMLLKRSSGGDVTRDKFVIRIILNFLLWLSVAGFVLQPVFHNDAASGKAIIVGKDVPADAIKRVRDSLRVADVFSEGNFKGKNFDTLTLLGQDFSPSFFAKLSQSLTTTETIKWIPYFGENQIESVAWKALVRKGQLQRISGTVHLSDTQWVKVKFGNETLDSVKLEKGVRYFDLSFPVFTERRTKADLYIGDNRETIEFFATPLPPLNFRFLLDNPDFESRNLASWLGNHGHSVEISTNLSKDIRSKLTLNKAGEADVIITDPKNASNPLVKKAIANGKSILFINLTNGSSDISSINSALGTKIQVKKISNEEMLPVAGELTKLPYDFVKSNGIVAVGKYPIAMERTTGKVAVSLLNETFPTLLNGDSISYGNIWTSVLAAVHPAYKSNLEITAPFYKGIKTEFTVNNLDKNPKNLQVGKDTIDLDYSAINGETARVVYHPSESGWLTLPDDSEINVTDSLAFNGYYKSKLIRDFVVKRQLTQSGMEDLAKLSNGNSKPSSESRISDWTWFLILILVFTALWIEPKFS